MGRLTDELGGWAAAGLISDDQVQSIIEFETRPRQATRVPLAAEAVGYVGGVLALVATIMLLGDAWDSFATPVQLLLIGLPTLLVTGLGGYLRTSDNVSAVRLATFLWALAVAGTTFWFYLLSSELLGSSDTSAAVHAGIAGTAVALVCYLLSNRTWQHLSLLASVVLLVVSAMTYWQQDLEAIGLLLWAIGVVWLLLTWGGLLPPDVDGYFLGSAVALAAPLVFTGGPRWAALLGLVTAIGLIAAGVALRRVLLLAAGGLGLFVHVPVVVFVFFGDALNPSLALLASSIILIVAAVVLGRLGRDLSEQPAGSESQPQPVRPSKVPPDQPVAPGEETVRRQAAPEPPEQEPTGTGRSHAPGSHEPGSHEPGPDEPGSDGPDSDRDPLSGFWREG